MTQQEANRMAIDALAAFIKATYAQPFFDSKIEARQTAANNAIIALRAVPADGWQPIETAPKDGTKIIFQNQTIGYWDADWNSDKRRPFWRWKWDDITYQCRNQPTHWHPIPNSPKERK